MNTPDLIHKLFSDPNVTITDLKKGLTNQNYLLHIDGENFVLRIPRIDSTQVVFRHHEAMALQAIKYENMDVETIYYDEKSGYKLTRYLPDAKTYQESNCLNKIEKVAALMKHFHALHKTIDESFHPIERLKQYQSYVQHPQYNLQPYAFVIEKVAQLHNPHVLCHNDWVDGNILFDKDNIYLIDYEYAANNDPLFDVMSFLTENDITDKEERERFYKVYFHKMNDITRQQLAIWEMFHHMLWCTWAMMMWDTRKEAMYQTIARNKYDALLQLNKKFK